MNPITIHLSAVAVISLCMIGCAPPHSPQGNAAYGAGAAYRGPSNYSGAGTTYSQARPSGVPYSGGGTYGSPYYRSPYDTTVTRRHDGANVYNWNTGDDIDIKQKYGNHYSGYNWKTGDDYDIKMKDNGRADVYNWKTGEDVELKRNSDGSVDSYNWTTGEWKTIDPY